MQLQGPKQKFGFGMSYAKKAFDYAIQADKVNELVSHLQSFIQKTKEELKKITIILLEIQYKSSIKGVNQTDTNQEANLH